MLVRYLYKCKLKQNTEQHCMYKSLLFKKSGYK